MITNYLGSFPTFILLLETAKRVPLSLSPRELMKGRIDSRNKPIQKEFRMKRGIIALSLLTGFSTMATAEIDTFMHYAGYIREGSLLGPEIPSEDGEWFRNDCPVCGDFESTIETFCVSRPQWDFQNDNYMDCDVNVKKKVGSSWNTIATLQSASNEEYFNCGQTCEDAYIRLQVYDYYGSNSGVVGVRFGKGNE